MCDDALQDIFVDNISHVIEELKQMVVKLKRDQDVNKKEFIPCFDHKQRNWNGFLLQSFKDVFSKKLKGKKVTLLEYHEAIDINLNDEKAGFGVVVFDTNK